MVFKTPLLFTGTLIRSGAEKTVLLPVKIYRYVISPFMAPCCRYYPTCSSYALTAIKKHGIFKGILLATARILRCHPWSGCHWHDEVPEAFAWRHMLGYKRRRNCKSAATSPRAESG